MGIIFTLLVALLGFFSALVTPTLQDSQTNARETTVRSDINSIYVKLEEFYNENGDYPTEKQLSEQGSDIFPGIDPQSLIDNNGVAIYERGSEYFYTPSGCTAVGCESYELGAVLENGETYIKNSLN